MSRFRFVAGVSALVVLTAAWGCSSDDNNGKNQPGSGGTTGGGGSGAGGSVTTGGNGGTGGGSGGSGGTADFVPNVYLPFAVDDVFSPTGFMGREDPAGPREVEGIEMDTESCPGSGIGAGGAGGADGGGFGGEGGASNDGPVCHTVTYTPQAIEPTFGSTWAGVFWQFPDDNWGTEQGEAIEPGATKVVFKAWAENDGQQVEFLVGGIGNLGDAYRDTFKVQKAFVLSDQPQEFELDLTNSTYTYVLGGFGWVLSTTTLDPIVFYIDDIRWVK